FTARCGFGSLSRALIWFLIRVTASLVFGFGTVTAIASPVSWASDAEADASTQATAAANKPGERLIERRIGDRSFGVCARGSPSRSRSQIITVWRTGAKERSPAPLCHSLARHAVRNFFLRISPPARIIF